jgi:DegV family protein with EDD domain
MRENKIYCAPLTFTIEEKDGTMTDYLDRFESEAEYVNFYNRLRGGAYSRTSKLNYQSHYEFFTGLAKAGAKDVLHFTISTGLSSTKEIAERAAADVAKLYPAFHVLVVDPLTATVGQGALVIIAKDCRDRGMGISETYDYVLSLRQYIQHFIVADDLDYLRRGGRVSGASAAIGSFLNIKPMLTFNAEGKLEMLEKNRGIKKSLRSMMEKTEKIPIDMNLKAIYIVHTDNYPAAEELRGMIVDKYGIEPHVSVMGPVIGSHLGPNGIGFGYISTQSRSEVLQK